MKEEGLSDRTPASTYEGDAVADRLRFRVDCDG